MQCFCAVVILLGFPAGRKKPLDLQFSKCHYVIMSKHIRKVSNYNGIMRITIPSQVVSKKRWRDVKYVIIDDQHPDRLEIRRFVDEEHLSGKAK